MTSAGYPESNIAACKRFFMVIKFSAIHNIKSQFYIQPNKSLLIKSEQKNQDYEDL